MFKKEVVDLFEEVVEGRYIFHYSDKGTQYLVLQCPDRIALKLVVTSEDFEVLYSVTYENVQKFYERDVQVKWFRPQIHNGVISIRGNITLNNETTYFVLNETKREISYESITDATEAITTYNLLSSMEGIKVIHAIQRKSQLYFIGEQEAEDKVKDYVFGEVDLTTDKMERFYFLDSDKGTTVPSSIDINHETRRVTIVGGVLTDKSILPYLETFLYKG